MHRLRLFPKYALLIIALVGGMLVAAGAVNLYFAWRETRAHLVALQAEKAQGAAARIEQYVVDIERQLGWTALPTLDAGGDADAIEGRRLEYLKLLRQVPPITEVTWIDAAGREQLKVSRLAIDTVAGGADVSREPRFTVARSGRTWYGPVYFRKETEPYMTIARPAGGGGVTAAEVNLKFVWEVVSRIRVGERGVAYVVDAAGALLAHPDISLVLKKTDLRALPQVAGDGEAGRDLRGAEVFAARAAIPALGWTVIVETPRAEALAPLYATLARLALVLAAGLALAAAASFLLARALVRPIRALEEGAVRIGAGELDRRIDVRSGDELERLAGQFNRMGERLAESYAGLERKVEERTAELSAALDQQTAISEVLRVISQSPTDVAPVFEAILDAASRLFATPMAAIFRYDGRLLHQVAVRNWPAEAVEDAKRFYPGPPDSRMVSGRVILSGRVQVERDSLADAGYDAHLARVGLWRRMLGAPLLRDGTPVGAIVLAWPDPGETSARHVELIQTFADQAVIAIENVRLLNETREALERQTATAEILKVISESPTDVQPVLEAVAQRAGLLCRAEGSRVWLVEPEADGGRLRAMTSYGAGYADSDAGATLPLRATSIGGRAALERRCLHVEDVLPLLDTEYPDVRALQARHGFRSVLAVPMLREGATVGVIALLRNAPRAFTPTEIALVQTFADQAVIAIENVRLFNETREALDQQTATAEVLQVISGSVADARPVFEKILASCRHLFDSDQQGILLIGDDARLHFGAHLGSAAARLQRLFPQTLLPDGPVGTTLRERRVLHFPDVLHGAGVPESLRAAAQAVDEGSYSQVIAPMLWEGRGVGLLYATRNPPRAFSDKELSLLKTFADQAAIAIENARLFRELRDKSLQLEQANQHKSEFLANMSHELRTPLNAIIGFSEVLAEQMFGEVNDKQLEYLRDIHSSGQHLLSLINDILDLSKIEAGRMELDLSTFDLGLLLDNSMTLVRERASRHGLTLTLDVGDGLDDWVADARKVKQVVINLLSNAVKFTPAGGSVTLRARRTDGAVEIAVIDTGVGIAAGDQALVFEEFRQAGGDYLRKSEGTGLGLSLARRFVELHGGSIRVDSAPGAGSTFAFTLPQRTIAAA